MDGLHPDHFESSPRIPHDIASGSSSLERELAPEMPSQDKVISHDDGNDTESTDVNENEDMTQSVIRVENSPDVDTPEEPAVFVCDAYGDVIGMADVSFFIEIMLAQYESNSPLN